MKTTHCILEYKGCACGYSGDLPGCDKSWDGANGCVAHGNEERFGGILLRGAEDFESRLAELNEAFARCPIPPMVTVPEGTVFLNDDEGRYYVREGEQWTPLYRAEELRGIVTPPPRATSPPSSDPNGHQP